jgi:hypothetical protein
MAWLAAAATVTYASHQQENHENNYQKRYKVH